MECDRQASAHAAHDAMHRRRFLAFASAVAGSAILVACGDGTAPAAATRTTNPTSAPTTGGGAVPTRSAGSATTGATGTTATGNAVATRAAGSAVTGAVTGTTLVIEAFDYGYKTMGSIPGGLTRVRLQNTGKDSHHAQFMRLNPDVTLEQLGAAFRNGPEAAFNLVTMVGGPGAIGPGGAAEVFLSLKEGQHMLACFVPGPDHQPHVAKGMVLPLIVTSPTDRPAAPQVDGAINMVDFTYEMPTVLPLGRSMWRITNTGAQFHELAVWQLMPGKTIDDLRRYFDAPPNAPPSGPPPALPMGGMQALTRGNEGILALDLPAGDYVGTCLVPDQSRASGDSHLHLGMIKGFSVR